MATNPLKLAIVGHTNVGKTSLLRTLARDSRLGVVAPEPSSTQKVVAAKVVLNDHPDIVVELYDTPGLEDGMGLFEYLDRLQTPTTRHDGPAHLRDFLASPEADQDHGQFAQEAKVIQQLLKSDAALYVIDARDPVLPKFQDELAILAKSARPVVPVLNFTAIDVGTPEASLISNNIHAWHQALAKVNLHAWVEFDSVSPPLDGETQIYQRLQNVLPNWQHALSRFIDALAIAHQRRYAQGCGYIAELIIDVAALRKQVKAAKSNHPTQDKQQLSHAVQQLQQTVRKREQHCVDSLLRLYNFTPDSVRFRHLSIHQGRWEMDLFNPHSLRQFGIKTSTGAATGAAAGAGIDVLLLGSSLGAGTLIGATAGGLWQSWQSLGRRLHDQWRGYRELTVDDAVLQLLLSRQMQLLATLSRRAHAAVEPTDIDEQQLSHALAQQKPLWQSIKLARSQPQWCALQQANYANTEARQRAQTELCQQLTLLPIPSK